MDAASRNPWTKGVTMTDLLSLPLRDAIDIPIAVHDNNRNSSGAPK
jgi:hypothetical protein